MINIDKLLKKKGWTGRELGRLEIYNAMYIYGMAIQGDPDPKGVVSKADFRKMLDTIKDPQEARDYNNYISVHEWLTRHLYQAQAQRQQTYFSFSRLNHFLITAEATEQTYRYIQQLPFIVTKKQIEDQIEKRKAERMTTTIDVSLCELLAWAVTHIITLYEENKRKKTPLKPLKKKLEAQTTTAPHILTSYNEIWGNGAYILPNGKRSSNMSKEEWLETVKPIIDELEKKHKDGEIQTTELVITRSHIEEAYTLAQDFLANYGYKWEYDEDPESLNKWALLLEGDFIENYYSGLLSMDREDQKEALEAFKEEYPELLEVALEYMKTFFTGIEDTEDWTEPLYSWEEVYSKEFAGFSAKKIEEPSLLWDGNYRAVFNGVAVYQKPLLLSDEHIDENGHYKEPTLEKTLEPLMLDSFFTESEYYADNIELIDTARKGLVEGYYYILGYNTTIQMIADILDIDGLGVMKINIAWVEEQVEAFNAVSKSLYREIQNTKYDEEFLKEKKLEVLENFFSPIDLTKIKLSEDTLKQIEDAIRSFKAFKENTYNPIEFIRSSMPEVGEGV